MNYVEKAKIHLARALIVNPEVLVMQRPLYHFGESVASDMLGAMREYVDNRGLCLPKVTKSRRRPRTLFFSPTNYRQSKQADVVWEITHHRQIEQVATNIEPRDGLY